MRPFFHKPQRTSEHMLNKLLLSTAALMTALSVATAADSVSLLGSWKITADTPQGETGESTLEISKKDSTYVGKATLEDGQELVQ